MQVLTQVRYAIVNVRFYVRRQTLLFLVRWRPRQTINKFIASP